MTRQPPLVSIIIPCCNDGKYLDEAVTSALRQTHAALEIIIVDDGSRDPYTVRLLQTYQRPRTRVFHTPNRGPAAARNFAIRRAAGKYLLPLDADDRIAPSYVARAVACLERDPRLGIVYCRARRFGDQRGEWRLPEYSLGRMLMDNMIFSTALFRKKTWERVGGYNPNMVYGLEDYDLWLSILEKEKCRVHRINQILFYYRSRRDSRTAKLKAEGLEQAMFRQLFRNHRQFYLRHLEAYFEGRMQLIRDLNRFGRLIETSPALKLERRLDRFPLGRSLYGGVLGAFAALLDLARRLGGK